MVPNPTQDNVFTALGNFLVGILPSGVIVQRAQANRVPPPIGSDYVLMTPLRQDRLETNIDSYADCLFSASITGTLMVVSQVQFGTIALNSQLFSPGLSLTGTLTVTAFLSGVGGVGTYTVSGSVTLSNQPVAAGIKALMQPVEWTIQLDVHGPNSGDNSVAITAAFRDDYAVTQFQTYGFDVTPLYADDAKQIAFITDQSQYEERWIIEACLQANQIVSVAQQFTNLLGPVVLNEVL